MPLAATGFVFMGIGGFRKRCNSKMRVATGSSSRQSGICPIWPTTWGTQTVDNRCPKAPVPLQELHMQLQMAVVQLRRRIIGLQSPHVHPLNEIIQLLIEVIPFLIRHVKLLFFTTEPQSSIIVLLRQLIAVEI